MITSHLCWRSDRKHIKSCVKWNHGFPPWMMIGWGERSIDDAYQTTSILKRLSISRQQQIWFKLIPRAWKESDDKTDDHTIFLPTAYCSLYIDYMCSTFIFSTASILFLIRL